MPTCQLCDNPAEYGIDRSHIHYCRNHSAAGMIHFTHVNHLKKYCQLCNTRSTYGIPGSKIALYCVSHKQEGMVDIKSKRCAHPGCDTRPTYNIPGSKIALYCSSHKQDGMIDIKHKRCAHPGCDIQPVYNIPGSKIALYCVSHKQEGMVDIKSKRCAHPGCDTRPGYGHPGQSPDHCASHRLAGDIQRPKSSCVHSRCKELATYGIHVPKHCEAHQLPNEVDLIQQECVSCHLINVVDRTGHCSICHPEFMVRAMHHKQRIVKEFLDAEGVVYISYDKIIEQGRCGRERPDFLLDCGTHAIVLEVDEDQHADRLCECEQTRMVNITQSLYLPTLFIRYNPDRYKPTQGRQMNTKQRHDALLRRLRHWSTNPLPDGGTTWVMYMFYDGDDPLEWDNLVRLN